MQVTSGAGRPSLVRGAASVVTCRLLRVLLGWIRIAARRAVRTATASGPLTMRGSLPPVLQGGTGPPAAVYLPAGTPPLAPAAALLLLGRQRAVIRELIAHR